MPELIKRTLTGLLIVGTLITGILLHPVSFFLLFLFVTIATLKEFYSLFTKNTDIRPQQYIGTISGAIIFSLSFFVAGGLLPKKMIYLLVLIPIVFSLVELFRRKQQAFTAISFTFLGIVYVALPFSCINFLIFEEYNFLRFDSFLVLSIFILIWTNDTLAYVFGSLLGKHRLFKRISPKKSWEGSIGGGIMTLSGGYVLSLFFTDFQLFQWLIIAFITVVMGTFGDLTESLLKRQLDIKDSGKILPGHGGFLDRFDSFLFVAPMIYVFVQIFC